MIERMGAYLQGQALLVDAGIDKSVLWNEILFENWIADYSSSDWHETKQQENFQVILVLSIDANWQDNFRTTFSTKLGSNNTRKIKPERESRKETLLIHLDMMMLNLAVVVQTKRNADSKAMSLTPRNESK